MENAMNTRVKDLADLAKLFPSSSSDEAATDSTASASPIAPAAGARNRALALSKLHIQLEKKGRKGKGVTVIAGFFHTEEDLQRFARELKTRCGSGGTVKDETIELQGDHRSTAAAYFRALGFKVTGVA